MASNVHLCLVQDAPEMETNLSGRLQATLLAIATVGLVALAVLNFRQDNQFQQPYDQVWWSEAPSGAGLQALRVLPNGPGEQAGIHVHDLLTAVNDHPVRTVADLERDL